MGATDGKRPDARAVAERAIALKYVVVTALATPPQDILAKLAAGWSEKERKSFAAEWKKDAGNRLETLGRFRRALTPVEDRWVQTAPGEDGQQWHIDASWRTEALHVLAWALRKSPTLLPFDEQASMESMKDLASGGFEQFVAAAKLRDADEIEKARDLAELWHWRSRTRELDESNRPLDVSPEMRAAGATSWDAIVRMSAQAADESGDFKAIGEDFPALGKAYRDLDSEAWSIVRSITIERHFALNWLCGYAPGNRWDETPTDT